MKGICRLCTKEKDLIKKSHIIPDFVYRNSGMYDDKHRLHKFDKEMLKNGRVQKVQTGVYSGGILCASCDNEVIGSYEQYASKAIYGTDIPLEDCPDCINMGGEDAVLSICSNMDYTNFKLFLLSIVFRAAISDHDFFNEVTLAEENLEQLRSMIYSGNPGNANDFPFIMGTFATSTDVTPDIIMNPAKTERDGLVSFNFVFGGMSYVFYEGKNINTEQFAPMVFTSDGVLRIAHFNGDDGNSYFRHLIGEE